MPCQNAYLNRRPRHCSVVLVPRSTNWAIEAGKPSNVLVNEESEICVNICTQRLSPWLPSLIILHLSRTFNFKCVVICSKTVILNLIPIFRCLFFEVASSVHDLQNRNFLNGISKKDIPHPTTILRDRNILYTPANNFKKKTSPTAFSIHAYSIHTLLSL